MSRYVHVNVYTPNLPQRWSPYRTSRLRAPLVWLAWFFRGLRFRLGRPELGRKVTLADMQPFHPGKPAKCLCRGDGMIRAHKEGEPGYQLCRRMTDAFRSRAAPVTADATGGPRWLKGFEPERLARG